MALSTPFHAYGIHSMVPYRRSDRTPYGIFKVLGGGTISLSAEFEDLFGGSNKYAVASEAKTVSSEFTATVKSLPDFLFELYLGASVAVTAAAALGSVTQALTNVNGLTVLDAVTGIASATIKAGSEADLKTGIYVVKAASATTVDVYVTTDIDFTNGTDIAFEDDSLKIVAAAITITTATAVEVTGTGIELTGGSGAIALVADESAYYAVAPAHGGVSVVTIGESSSVFPEHGIVAMAAKRANGDIMEIDLLKCVGAGFPLALEETVYSIPELTIKVLYDSCSNAIAKIRKIKGAGDAC